VFARRFRRERLSNSRWAEQIDDQTVSFAFDEVIESNFLMVRFDEGLEEVLAVVGEDEVSECVGVPIDIANFLNFEIHYEEKIKFARETGEKEELTPHFIHETEAEDNSRCEEQIFIGSSMSACWLLMLYLLSRKYQSELRDMTTTVTVQVQKTTGRLLDAEGAVRSILSL